jgi:hypothetical protein
VYCSFSYSYSQEFDGRLFESTFLRFEEEIVFQQFCKDSADIGSVAEYVLQFGFVFSPLGVYCHVVHIDCHPLFCYFFRENRVHHHLERGWGVGEAEKHDGRFE